MDGLLLTINRDFLKYCESRGMKVSSIRVRYLVRNSTQKAHRFRSFKTLNDYTKYHSSVFTSGKPLCSAGDFPIIENIEFDNQNLNFENSYRWYNISQQRKLVEKIRFDSFRREKQITEVERYKTLMNKLINWYILNTDKAIKARLDSYVDPCYIDSGYVSPNSDPGTIETFKLLDGINSSINSINL